MIRRTVAVLFASFALSYAALAVAPARPRPTGKTVVVCPPGEKKFNYKWETWDVEACQPAVAGNYCAKGRIYARSPSNGLTACMVPSEETWLCPAGEKPRNFKLGAKVEMLCEPALANTLCQEGRVLVRSPATGQSACTPVGMAGWYCPKGEQPANFIEGGHVATACVPSAGAACAKGRRAVRNVTVNHLLCMK